MDMHSEHTYCFQFPGRSLEDVIPFRQLIRPLGGKVDGFFDYKLMLHEVTSRSNMRYDFDALHTSACFAYNLSKKLAFDFTDDGKLKGVDCKDPVQSRIAAANAVHNSAVCFTTLLEDIPKPNISMSFEVFVDHNDTQSQATFVIDRFQDIYSKKPHFLASGCDCARAAKDDWPSCGYFQTGHTILDRFADICSVVDLCSQIDVQLILDVGHNCNVGEKARNGQASIIESVCNPEQSDNSCSRSVEKVFDSHLPRDVVECLYHSNIDFYQYSMILEGIPKNLNISKMLGTVLSNKVFFEYATMQNLGCSLLYKADKEYVYSYEPIESETGDDTIDASTGVTHRMPLIFVVVLIVGYVMFIFSVSRTRVSDGPDGDDEEEETSVDNICVVYKTQTV